MADDALVAKKKKHFIVLEEIQNDGGWRKEPKIDFILQSRLATSSPFEAWT